MPKTQKIIQSFNAGELSRLMDARTDQVKYAAGCRTMENFIALIYGGAQERPGLEYIAGCKSNSAKSRLIAFEHSVDDTYILEFANQVIRVFKSGARVFTAFTSEDLSAHTSNIKAHWLMNDNTSSSVVIDADGATHNGALYDGANATGGATQETQDVSTANDAGTANKAFDMSQLTGGVAFVNISDSADFTFGNGTTDSVFSLLAVVKLASDSTRQDIITKYTINDREWELYVDTDDKVVFKIHDDSAGVSASIKADDALTDGAWSFIVVTYSGESGVTAANGMALYINWRLVSSTATNDASYTAMENKDAPVQIGASGANIQVKIDRTLGTVTGDMVNAGGIAAAFDGVNPQSIGASAKKDTPPVDGPVYIGKDWGSGVTKIVTGFKGYGATTEGFINATNPTVTITLQGSNNSTNGIDGDWTDLDNASDTDASDKLIQDLTVSDVSTAYRFHRLKITHNDGTNASIFCAEAEFYETPIATLKSTIDNVAVLNVALTAEEIAALISTSSTDPLEIMSPYLTADLFQLKFESSADVIFITHPSYEQRKLSRLSDTSWTLEELDLRTGPFRDQNTDTTKTIAASAKSGTGITLTASGHAPFVAGTTAGHAPSGTTATSKSATGALFKLIHSSATPSIVQDLNSTTLNDATSTLTVKKGVTWDFTTNGTWGSGGPSAIVLERSYDAGSNYETVHTVVSLANKNIITSGTEDVADAIYRARVSDGSGTGTANIHISIRDTSIDGIVEITSVTSTTVAVGNVLATLGSTDATNRWSEGSFSNRRGWPIDVTISSEERLTFAGNKSEPLTTWASVIGDFTDFKLGTNDDAALNLTLVGSGQQNRIRWILSKETLVMGTVGGEHLLGASKREEALTPSNIKAKLQTTYGSEDIAAIIVNQTILFVQRGGKKIREFLYNFEDDAYKADDLTVFSNEITGSGITDIAFQRTPDPILWCVRSDGQMAIMSYERDQDVFSWSRLITQTNLAGAKTDSSFESVAVIYGGAGNEDEVWVTVKRTIDGSPVRYVERFFQREMPSAIADMKYLDSYITYTGGTTTATGLGHLVRQTVQVLGDGVVQSEDESGDFIVTAGGQITLPAAFTTVQIGLGYTATVKPMKIDLQGLGLAVTKKINRGVFNVFETIGGKVGTSTSALHDIPTGTAALFTGSKEIPLSGGYSREGDIIAQQTDPLPMTILSFSLDIGASND